LAGVVFDQADAPPHLVVTGFGFFDDQTVDQPHMTSMRWQLHGLPREVSGKRNPLHDGQLPKSRGAITSRNHWGALILASVIYLVTRMAALIELVRHHRDLEKRRR